MIVFFQVSILVFSCLSTSSGALNANASVRYDAIEVVDKSPKELVELRGFIAETHHPVTKDGYLINVVRIINPKNQDDDGVFKRPVIFNHGLLESGTIWLINSRYVRPIQPSKQCGPIPFNTTDSDEVDALHINAPFMLSNYGYDVWVMSMRGTDFSTKHKTLDPKDPRFWDYSLDDFALTDIPTVIDYVRQRTGAQKIGYVGHSQATFSIFGLLSVRTRYSKILEPVIAVAPVSYFENIVSMSRILFVGAYRIMSPNQHGPFPFNSQAIRKSTNKFCLIRSKDLICQLMDILISGYGKKMPAGFYSHMPFYTSFKVLRHFGQLIDQGRNMMYDYGPDENLRLYGKIKSPNYPIERINSKSLCLFRTEADALSPPKDVAKFKNRLTVKLYRDVLIKGSFNHMDLITDLEAADLVFKPMLEIFEGFEADAGGCIEREREIFRPSKVESRKEPPPTVEDEEEQKPKDRGNQARTSTPVNEPVESKKEPSNTDKDVIEEVVKDELKDESPLSEAAQNAESPREVVLKT